MSTISVKRRSELKASTFGLPDKRAYPMENKSHARNALARASEMSHKGKLSDADKAKIVAKARRILAK